MTGEESIWEEERRKARCGVPGGAWERLSLRREPVEAFFNKVGEEDRRVSMRALLDIRRMALGRLADMADFVVLISATMD